MKLIETFLLTLTLVASGTTATEDHEFLEQESIFQRTFGILHQPPQIQQDRNRKDVETLWITQKLDNFNEQDNTTWQMRYMANDEFYQQGGPLFIFIGGEWEISPGYVQGGHWYDMAKEHNGYLFYTEHRFYGQSKPTRDLITENLKYLNVQQALADLAHFIRTMKATIPGMTNSKVFLAGRSYSATMVTWFKKLYPDLANGCWASSAPLFAKLEFIEYKEVVGESIRLVGGEACYQRIHNAITELEDMLNSKRSAEVKAILKICNNFDESNDLDVYTFFSEISEIFAGVVQRHDKGDIEGVCDKIMTSNNDLEGFANYIVSYFKSNTCTDLSYKASLNTFMDSTYSNNIMRQWMYQTCNEYGWYQTSGSRNQPFGTQFPLTLFIKICSDAYGKQYGSEFISQQIVETNKFFGGLSPNIKNVYMTHGQLDPWRPMGIQDESQATIIPDHAHCKDFDSISPNDSAALRASKEKIASLIREWMQEA